MRALVLDTEYTWAPGLSRSDEDGTERVPHPPNAVVEAVAWVSLATSDAALTPPTVKLGTIQAPTERERVVRVLTAWQKTRPRLVTFGGRAADIPVLSARCLHHGIAAPDWWGNVVFGNRYRGETHHDLHDLLGQYGAQRRGTLDDWARACGWPGKGDVDGSDVARLLEGGQRDVVDAYCLSDAVQTAAVYLRYCLATGELSPNAYTALAEELLRVVDADPRVRQVGAQVDRSRFVSVAAVVGARDTERAEAAS